MPCGCVAGVYRAGSADLEWERVEAKGPNCPHFWHQMGRIVRLGLADEWDLEGHEPLV